MLLYPLWIYPKGVLACVTKYEVLYDPKLRELFDHMIHLDLTFDECLLRRTTARSPLNPNPLSPQDVVDLAARRLMGIFTFKSFESRNRIWHVTSFEICFPTNHCTAANFRLCSPHASSLNRSSSPFLRGVNGWFPQTVALRFGRLMSGTWR